MLLLISEYLVRLLYFFNYIKLLVDFDQQNYNSHSNYDLKSKMYFTHLINYRLQK